MGEQIYDVMGWNGLPDSEWKQIGIQFSEMDDDWNCLCTFPHNDQGVIDVSRMRSLALFGAAVVLAHNGELGSPILPNCVPEWIRNEIKRLLPDMEEE